MYANSQKTTTATQSFAVTLDGQPLCIPVERKSLSAIRAYLERLALEQQRVLSSFKIDGLTASSVHQAWEDNSFRHIDAETTELNGRPSQVLGTAADQVVTLRALVETAVAQVLINDGPLSREIWWELSRKLKEPLLLLGLLPETVGWPTEGCASLQRVRKWQLEQLAIIMKDVDEACWATETSVLSHALESRVLPWLGDLERTINLWHQTLLAGDRLRAAGEDSCLVFTQA